MNFQDLYKKIADLDKPVTEGTDAPIEECGDMMPLECGDMLGGPTHAPKQADSVTMSVNMNGSGSGGIKDLLNILKDIEHGAPNDHDKLLGTPGEVDQLVGDSFENSVEGGSDIEVYGTDAITPTGDDLHSKGEEAPKVNGGGNPFNVSETLVSRLSNLYNEVKSR